MESNNLIQNYVALVEAGMMATTIYLSVLTAYLFTAYTVGAKLSLFQHIFVTVLFLVFASVFTFATWGLLNAAVTLYESRPDSDRVQTYLAFLIGFSQAAGILGALMFMLNIRRKNES